MYTNEMSSSNKYYIIKPTPYRSTMYLIDLVDFDKTIERLGELPVLFALVLESFVCIFERRERLLLNWTNVLSISLI